MSFGVLVDKWYSGLVARRKWRKVQEEAKLISDQLKVPAVATQKLFVEGGSSTAIP